MRSRVRGLSASDRTWSTPHPNPLPQGERGLTAIVAASSQCFDKIDQKRCVRSLSSASCLRSRLSPAHAQERLNVVASFSILGDFVRNVGGDRVNVTTLVGPDGDAHVYTPTPADAKKIADAKLVVVNGLGLEGWLPRLVQSAGSKATIVTATAGIAPLQARLRCRSACLAIGRQRQDLCRQYPRRAGRGRSRRMPRSFAPMRRAYLAKLDALDREVREAVAQIPQERRKVISTHDAFGYFAAAYGIDFIAPLGVSTESEASARDIAAHHHPDQGRENPGGFSGKYQRSPADPADRGRDRRQGRRDAVFRQSDRRKGRGPHLH